jgi:hypothetical protein
MLDIHEHNGQLALKAAGLFDKFLTIIHPGGQQGRALDKHGNLLFDHPDDGTGGRPEAPRGELRRILLESLPADAVRWGMMFAMAPGKGIIAHREPNGVLHTYAGLKKSEDWVAGINFADPPAVVAWVAKEFDGWAAEDGAELAKAIAANPEEVETALSRYEASLFPRSAAEAAEAERMQQVLFGDNSPQSLLDFFAAG